MDQPNKKYALWRAYLADEDFWRQLVGMSDEECGPAILKRIQERAPEASQSIQLIRAEMAADVVFLVQRFGLSQTREMLKDRSD